MSRWAAILALSAAGLTASCTHESQCEDHDRARESRELAKYAFDGGHFDQAKELYTNAMNKCTQNYDARIGVANSCRALGTQLYQQADQLASVGKRQQAEKVFMQANNNHAQSDQLFRTAMVERPDDVDPHYGIGLLWYDRCTSPIAAPYRSDDVENRQRERDQAIKEFTLVLTRMPQSSQAHRYRGLAYLAADRIEEGASDLKIYHDSRQDLYNKIVGTWPSLTPEDKRRKDIALRAVEKEIDDVREVIVLEQGEMVDRTKVLKKKEREAQGPAEVQKITQEIAHLSRQQLVLEGMIKSFALTKMGEIEQAIVKRCREYLEAFNRGKVNEVLVFLGPRKGEEKQLRESVSAKVDRGMQFKKVVFRTAVVSNETASVGFVCDLVTGQVSHPESEVTIRWRVVGGQWLVSDHP